MAARFVQGLFVPALTTCLAAYLSANLPLERLNVVMGSYVSATVAGGLGGRLLGGWIHPPLHWRYAFVTASLLVVAATLAAVWRLPAGKLPGESEPEARGLPGAAGPAGAAAHLSGGLRGLFRLFLGLQLPAVLSAPAAVQRLHPAHHPAVPLLSHRGLYRPGGREAEQPHRQRRHHGPGLPGLRPGPGPDPDQIPVAIVAALALVCAGFFAIHAAAAGSLNRKLTASRGRANSLYVLAYYLGGAAGITLSGYAYGLAGWPGVAALGIVMLTLPLATGLPERRQRRGAGRSPRKS